MNRHSIWHSARITLAGALAVATLAGCGSSLIAPENPASDAFLDRVDKACGNLGVGNSTVSDLLDGDGDDGTFLDETAKLSDGRTSPNGYREMINSFYPLGDSSAAIDCVLNQAN